ncbi:(2Fe-2S)-binding protein [Cupriavidus sp. TA19]|uniref:aromatic ring-hydroxylating oxygenase subunit alpha n=1 Tax=Cupriavidus sp. TA19 TaxID=701108 RepID=UPI00272940E3|nr:aromatic ring-hydroxylating dioxygenase subunit alpha [Cupriavidus sp. TA19]GLC95404.1 (2Fe-2S)-binding protein [Cupriavidus sp. TA19]
MQHEPTKVDRDYLRHFWHPVATVTELEKAHPSSVGPMGVTLLNEQIVIAKLGEQYVAMRDRCAHRSAKLSCGKVQDGRIQCPYHGWQYDTKGVCQVIPACPDNPIPNKARVANFDCEERYGLIWVRLDSSYDCTQIPYFSAAENPRMRIVVQDPYWWKATAERRWENFTDFSHFAFIHPGTLFDPNNAEPPVVPMDRVNGQFRFIYETPQDMNVPDQAPIGTFSYHCSMPFAINLAVKKYTSDSLHVLFNVSCPVDDSTTKNFLIFAREQADDSDYLHIAFNNVVFAEDQPVIESQWPQDLTSDEVSVVTDKVSVQYRKWLRELREANREGREAFRKALLDPQIESNRKYADLTQ